MLCKVHGPVCLWLAELRQNWAMNALNVSETIQALGLQAKVASALMASASAAIKNRALIALAGLLRTQLEALQVANAQDLERARANGLSAPMVDRLKLTPQILETCAQGCRAKTGSSAFG